MADSILEKIIETVFGANWLTAMVILLVLSVTARLTYKSNLPKYIKICLIISTGSISILLLSFCYPWINHPIFLPVVKNAQRLLCCIAVIFILILLFRYRRIDNLLDIVIKNTKPGGNKITAWKELQSIKASNLTSWQKKKYNKRRLYLRVFLGNMCGADQELDKFKDDKPFYYYMKAIILNYKGNHKEELEMIKLAEDSCDGETDPILHFQIIANRGVAYVGAGEYSLANDFFKKAIDFGIRTNLDHYELWLNTYYNYVFNKTRLNPDIQLQKCLDILEDVKKYIDIEDPKQYIAFSNIVIELMRQKNANRQQIDEVVNRDFEYIVNTDLTDIEKCVFEAATARMVCTGRLTPEIVIEHLSKDKELFMNLPMPERYRCFKEIDYMFKDLRGSIVEKNQQIKETAHWYMVNQAIKDIDEYRESLPSEAVYEICYCLKEHAGLLKNRQEQYEWRQFLKNMRSAQRLYRENELLADSVLCCLDIMDEATSELNIDAELKSIHMDVMQEELSEVELFLPQLVEHPILYEIYLRLSIYCLAMDDVEKSREYYKKYRMMGNFSINHFAPWLRGKYSIISLVMLVIEYIEAVDRIAAKDLSIEMAQIQDWFKGFHDRNGYFEAIVLGRVLDGEILPMYIDAIHGLELDEGPINARDIKEAFLVIPALSIKIKCNEYLTGKVIGEGGLISDCSNSDLRFCNVNTITSEIRKAIERISDMIKKEMPDYIMSSEELNNLTADCWFNVVNEYAECQSV